MPGPSPILPQPRPHPVPTPSIVPPDPMAAPATQYIRLAALQAIRAKAMAHTVGAEYQQPAHAFLAELLPDNPELHRQVVLPGAKRAVHLDALETFHARGLTPTEIVKEINVVTAAALAHRQHRFTTWRDGERAEHLSVAREREAKRQALMTAKSAQVEAELAAEGT